MADQKLEITEQDVIIEQDGSETNLVPFRAPAALSVARPPAQVLEEAREAANALIDMIKASPDLGKKIDGREYLKFEAWQTIGKFYGATVKVTDTKYLEYGEVKGFEAKAVVINANTGFEISGAEAMCLNDEKNWKSKPLFQLKSMAQTRASAKALRNVFAWVVVLAGYKPTPAEEMDGVKPQRESSLASSVIEGIIENPTMSGGSLFFKIGNDLFYIPPMRGSEMKETLSQADKAFVELEVSPKEKTKAGRDCQQVYKILKYEPQVPF